MTDPTAMPTTPPPARPRLFVHVGHYKTGTSAIQDYLSRHADALKAEGFLYPAAARSTGNATNHGPLALTLGRIHGFAPPPWYVDKMSVDQAFRAFHTEAQAHPDHTVILSSEEFMQLALRDDPKRAVSDLAARLNAYDVRVVFYIREPFSLLKSWYNEVNKGDKGTRNFPTFFLNLNREFLAQERLWQVFAEIFGPQNLLVRPYVLHGADHIRDFLQTVGSRHEPTEQPRLIQAAQPLEKLEIVRLSKDRGHDFDEATVTQLNHARRLIDKTEYIAQAYDRLTAKTTGARPAALSAEAVIDHYADLLRPAVAAGLHNQKEAGKMRDLALGIEKRAPALALALMNVAHLIRPEGGLIARKLAEYRAAATDRTG